MVLDEELLEEATRVLGAKTYSAAINEALTEAIRVRKVRSLKEHFGSGAWEGTLSEMREDAPRAKEARAGRR